MQRRKGLVTFPRHVSGMTLRGSRPPQTAAAAVQEEVQRVLGTVAVAAGLAAGHRTVDLTGLDMATGALCARVLDLAPEEGRTLRPALTELDNKLQQLAAALNAGRHDS